MPGSTVDPISSTLKRSFGGSRLEEGLEVALSKRSLMPVTFEAPSRISSPGPLKHYILLNSISAGMSPTGVSGAQTAKDKDKDSNGVEIPRPKITFYRQQDVRVGYRGHFPPGAGMMNVGNTCYLNSTLQALFHTPALLNYLSDGSHRCNGTGGGGFSLHGCTICALSLTLKDTHRTHVVRPSRVYEKLKTICKHLVHGRQEDAHEFLRYLIESLQKSFLLSMKAKNVDNPSKETTPFNQIFGGYMRQDVTCVRCKYVSTTFQHFMDLLLDIRSASNIEEALCHYFRPEKLGGNDGSNMYKCEKCKVKVPAQKSSLIERPPVVLCIQLKRFALTGGKISKSVQLNRRLELSRFVRSAAGRNNALKLEYRLVSMITHVGPSPNCGHYTAIGEASNGQFYQFDDSHVRPVPVSQALNTASYVVMYEMTPASHSAWTKSSGGAVVLKSNSAAATSNNGLHVAKQQPKVDTKVHAQNSSSPLISRGSNGLVKPTTNGVHKIAPAVLTSNLPKKLVPYDELDSSSTEEDEKPPVVSGSQNGIRKEVTNGVHNNGSTASSKPTSTATTNAVVEPSKSTIVVNDVQVEKKSYNNSSSGFLPVAVALKQQQGSSSQDEKRPSASGTWRVVDMEHHNPSIHSDNSSGSGSQWKIHSVQQGNGGGKRPDSDSEISRSSHWSVKQTVTASTNSDSEGSPKKMKKMNAVKEAFSNTFGRFFPIKGRPAMSNGSEASKLSNGASSSMSNGHSEPSKSLGNTKDESLENKEESLSADDDKRLKKRKNRFSNGLDEESPSKKYNSDSSRWNGSSNGSSGVVDELLRQSTLSEKVTSWNGVKSSTFSSSVYNNHRSRSDDSRDRYDEELDRGRRKKIKRRHSDSNTLGGAPYSNNGGVNPFQMCQQNGFHHRSNSSSFKDYNNGRRRNFYHNNGYHHRSNSFRNNNSSFDEGKFRKEGYRNDYNHHHHHNHRSRR